MMIAAPCSASVMPESPQTMISLVANYAAGITTLPRKPGRHDCRAAPRILWCQEVPATVLIFLDCVLEAICWLLVQLHSQPDPNKYFRYFLIYPSQISPKNSESQDAPKKPVLIGLRPAHS